MIKFNGRITIPKVVEQCTHGLIEHGSVFVDVSRTNDEVWIYQDDNKICLSVDQVMKLERFLREHLE